MKSENLTSKKITNTPHAKYFSQFSDLETRAHTSVTTIRNKLLELAKTHFSITSCAAGEEKKKVHSIEIVSNRVTYSNPIESNEIDRLPGVFLNGSRKVKSPNSLSNKYDRGNLINARVSKVDYELSIYESIKNDNELDKISIDINDEVFLKDIVLKKNCIENQVSDICNGSPISEEVIKKAKKILKDWLVDDEIKKLNDNK